MAKALKVVGAAALFLATGPFGITPLIQNALLATVARAGALVLASSAFRPKPPSLDRVEDHERNLRLAVSPTAPRRILYGTSATGGDLVYRETTNGNKDLWMVIALAGHEIDGFQEFQWGGNTVTFSGNSAQGEFNGKMFLYERLGKDNQTAISALTGASSDWTTNHRLRGVAYAVLKLVADTEKFSSGVQNALFILRGRKLYDPRKDSTNGGSGAHRLNDQSTWEFSDNPVLAIVDYLRGIRVNNSVTTSYDGTLIAGMGIAAGRIDWANIIAEANICDEQVPLDAGGSEKRYTCNGWIDPSASHRDNLDQLASAMSGTVAFQGGKWRVYAAAARAAVKVRNENHIIGGLNLRTKKSAAQKINVISARYPDVEADYQIKSSPPLRNSTYIAQDGGSEHPGSLSLPMCTSKTEVQRHMKIALERSRREMAAKAVFSPVALQDQAMDTLQLTYGALGLSGQKMVCVDWALRFTQDENGNTGLLIEEELAEEDDAIYAWDPATDEQAVHAPGAAPALSRSDPTLGEIGGVVDFATQVGGAEKPQDNANRTGENLLLADAAKVNSALGTAPYEYSGFTTASRMPIADLGVAAGDKLTLRGEVRSLDGLSSPSMVLDFYDSGGARTAVFVSPDSDSTSFTEVTIEAVIPANTTEMEAFGGVSSGSGDREYRRAVLQRGPAASLVFSEPRFNPEKDSADFINDGTVKRVPSLNEASGGGRGFIGLDSSGDLQSNVRGDAFIDGSGAAAIADGGNRALLALESGTGLLKNQVHSLVRMKDRILDNISDTSTRKAVTPDEKTGAARAFSALDSQNRLQSEVGSNALFPGGASSGNVEAGANRSLGTINSSNRLKSLKSVPLTRVAGPGTGRAGNPLSATDAGASATISVAAHSVFMGESSATSYGSASLTGLPFSTTHRVYQNDDSFNGGSSYATTTSVEVIGQYLNRYYVGDITTPADGGGGTSGGGGGGGPASGEFEA